MVKSRDYYYQPISALMHTDSISLDCEMTVREALEYIRKNSGDDQIVYFYVTDNDNILKGVIPTRRLLTADLDTKIEDLIDRRIKYIPEEAALIDVWEMFIFHRFLALPVVDKDKHLVGVVDVSLFTDNVANILEYSRTDEIFETIGFRYSQIRNASALKVFRFRFPWLTATIISGIISAIMVSRFELVLAQSIMLAFFLTLVLGLGESVSMQSMTVTIQAFRNIRPTVRWYIKSLLKELKSAFMLGLASGVVVFFAIILWQKDLLPAVVIGGSIIVTITVACLIGLTIPSVLHLLKLDLKIASGPLTLALADIFTIVIYFSVASLFL